MAINQSLYERINFDGVFLFLFFLFIQGGMKAVIWTDVIMFCVMFATTLMVIIMGTIKAGGFNYVWDFNHDEGRLDVF